MLLNAALHSQPQLLQIRDSLSKTEANPFVRYMQFSNFGTMPAGLMCGHFGTMSAKNYWQSSYSSEIFKAWWTKWHIKGRSWFKLFSGWYHSTELGGTRKFTEQQFQLSSLFDEKVKCCFTLNYDSYIVFGGVSGHLGSLQSHWKAFGLLLW